MNLRIIPLSVVLKPRKDYKLSILGIHWDSRTMGVGFSLTKNNCPNKIEWILHIHFYTVVKTFVVKTIMHPYQLICSYCGKPVWKHNLYCPNCLDELSYDEVIRVPEYSEDEEVKAREWYKKYVK